MKQQINEALALIRQAIAENTQSATAHHGSEAESAQQCVACEKLIDPDYEGHDETCFVGWLEEAAVLAEEVRQKAAVSAAAN